MFFKLLRGRKIYINNKNYYNNKYIHGDSFSSSPQKIMSVRSFSEYINIEEKINLPRLKLRGLPFDASEEEIKNFFRDFQLTKQAYPVHIIKGIKNKPTGHAYVYFDDEEEARNACQAMNRKYIRDRFVEIYLDYIYNHNLTPVKEHVTTLMRDRYKKDNQ
ncbi:RNA-binding protein, putative [Plasmodium sp. DRC-Itaito]|nr:RNA-binding protein, putative [Plasmodium sp. DRC-Itaito]